MHVSAPPVGRAAFADWLSSAEWYDVVKLAVAAGLTTQRATYNTEKLERLREKLLIRSASMGNSAKKISRAEPNPIDKTEINVISVVLDRENLPEKHVHAGLMKSSLPRNVIDDVVEKIRVLKTQVTKPDKVQLMEVLKNCGVYFLPGGTAIYTSQDMTAQQSHARRRVQWMAGIKAKLLDRAGDTEPDDIWKNLTNVEIQDFGKNHLKISPQVAANVAASLQFSKDDVRIQRQGWREKLGARKDIKNERDVKYQDKFISEGAYWGDVSVAHTRNPKKSQLASSHGEITEGDDMSTSQTREVPINGGDRKEHKQGKAKKKFYAFQNKSIGNSVGSMNLPRSTTPESGRDQGLSPPSYFEACGSLQEKIVIDKVELTSLDKITDANIACYDRSSQYYVTDLQGNIIEAAVLAEDARRWASGGDERVSLPVHPVLARIWGALRTFNRIRKMSPMRAILETCKLLVISEYEKIACKHRSTQQDPRSEKQRSIYEKGCFIHRMTYEGIKRERPITDPRLPSALIISDHLFCPGQVNAKYESTLIAGSWFNMSAEVFQHGSSVLDLTLVLDTLNPAPNRSIADQYLQSQITMGRRMNRLATHEQCDLTEEKRCSLFLLKSRKSREPQEPIYLNH